VPLGVATRRATDFISRFVLGGGDKSRLSEEVAAVVANPGAFTNDPLRGEFAKTLLAAPPPPRTTRRGVKLLSAGLDEAPMVYKDIHKVMAAQSDLVRVLGQFDPKLVKMAPGGERAED
jgi:hypothetical protein